MILPTGLTSGLASSYPTLPGDFHDLLQLLLLQIRCFLPLQDLQLL